MANGPALSTARGREIYVGSEFRDSISLLDVLYANEFEGEFFDPELLEQIDKNFYRGAPPKWLNFYISEQEQANESGGIIKRDGYNRLEEQIHQRKKYPGISTVKLFHQPGCGGTTLAMQVLWDLRKSFRCAVLTSSPSDITNVANEVINLYQGIRDLQNTVLLLVNDEQILENLQNSIMEKIAEQEIVTHMPVVIFLSCIRKVSVVQNDNVVLKNVLSDTEKQKFDEKKKELSLKYRDKCEQFHGFNIMQTNFSPDYVQQACKVFSTVRRANRPRKAQLVAFLSLLNDYVPGSYLTESQCLDFLKHEDYNFGDLEDRMEPFSHLITFQQDERSEKKVSMAHPMIAQFSTKLMAEAGVTRSDTARNFLDFLCSDEVPPYLVGFVKDMLTKRETKKEENPISGTETDKDQERFSRLILDIQKMEEDAKSASVLKVASKKFDQNPFFPQALARFYYIELKDYNQAEIWAKQAKERDPQNSFVADTLGQVHKNHLKSKECHPKEQKSKKLPAKPREILQLAKKAIEAFKDEEQLAENQHGTDMKEDGTTKVSNVFNNRGLFGYLQVCNLVYDLLVSQDETWRRVLTKNVSIGSVLNVLGDNKLNRFNDLIRSLRDEVERKCAFFDKYLTYSKPGMNKDDAPYISRDTLDCYRKYVGDSPPENLKQKVDVLIQKLKQNLAETSAGVISCLDREYTQSDLKEMTTWWEEIFQRKDSLTALANYIFSHIMLINMGGMFRFDYKFLNTFVKKTPLTSKDTPELHLLNLLLCWPTDSEDKCVHDLSQLIQCMHDSYEHAYKAYFQSRYLRPLFFIGKGQGLNRIVHRKVLEGLFPKENEETKVDWSNEKIFQHFMVQERLIKVEGVVRKYRIYATVGGKEIEVNANLRNSLWRRRHVSFYLGFTIRGPVAFGIQTKTAGKELDSAKPGPVEPELFASTNTTRGPSDGLRFGACRTKMNSGDLTKLQPKVIKEGEVHIYSLHSEAGYYECSVSFLRWICKEVVSLTYRFCSWEEYRERPSRKDYMPAGPLLDITITAGKLEEVYLPHWIDYDSTMSDMFAALHVDTCGDFVEQVSEVTSSHIKLCQPTFSPKGAMILEKLGFRVKVYYDILIYKTNKEFLTLHVYLVPPDGHIQKEVEEKETSYGSIIIRKPNPDKSLQMQDHFFLTADMDTAEILPEKLKLTSGRRNLNFFEVFIRNAENDFCLKLESKQKRNDDKDAVWTSIIRKGDYQNQSTDLEQGQHFVDRHRTALINNVSDTGAILDRLMQRGLISQEIYDNVRALTTTQNMMRDILRICSGRSAKDALLDILKGMKTMKALIRDLED